MRTLIIFSFLFISFSATAQVAVKEGPNSVYFFSAETVELTGQHNVNIKVLEYKKGFFRLTYITDGITFILPRRGKGFKMIAHTGETIKVLPDEIISVKAY